MGRRRHDSDPGTGVDNPCRRARGHRVDKHTERRGRSAGRHLGTRGGFTDGRRDRIVWFAIVDDERDRYPDLFSDDHDHIPDAHPGADSDGNASANGHADPGPDGNARANGHADGNADPGSHGQPRSDTDPGPDGNARANGHADGNADPGSHGEPRSDTDAGPGNSGPDADAGPDGQPRSDIDTGSGPDIDTGTGDDRFDPGA